MSVLYVIFIVASGVASEGAIQTLHEYFFFNMNDLVPALNNLRQFGANYIKS